MAKTFLRSERWGISNEVLYFHHEERKRGRYTAELPVYDPKAANSIGWIVGTGDTEPGAIRDLKFQIALQSNKESEANAA